MKKLHWLFIYVLDADFVTFVSILQHYYIEAEQNI